MRPLDGERDLAVADLDERVRDAGERRAEGGRDRLGLGLRRDQQVLVGAEPERGAAAAAGRAAGGGRQLDAEGARGRSAGVGGAAQAEARRRGQRLEPATGGRCVAAFS